MFTNAWKYIFRKVRNTCNDLITLFVNIKLYEYYVSKNNATTQMTHCLFSSDNKHCGSF